MAVLGCFWRNTAECSAEFPARGHCEAFDASACTLPQGLCIHLLVWFEAKSKEINQFSNKNKEALVYVSNLFQQLLLWVSRTPAKTIVDIHDNATASGS